MWKTWRGTALEKSKFFNRTVCCNCDETEFPNLRPNVDPIPLERGRVILLNTILPGYDVCNRTGTKIEMVYLTLKIKFVRNLAFIPSDDHNNDEPIQVRVLVYYDKQTNGNAPHDTITHILKDVGCSYNFGTEQYERVEYSDFLSGLDPGRQDRYLILHDDIFSLPAPGNQIKYTTQYLDNRIIPISGQLDSTTSGSIDVSIGSHTMVGTYANIGTITGVSAGAYSGTIDSLSTMSADILTPYVATNDETTVTTQDLKIQPSESGDYFSYTSQNDPIGSLGKFPVTTDQFHKSIYLDLDGLTSVYNNAVPVFGEEDNYLKQVNTGGLFLLIFQTNDNELINNNYWAYEFNSRLDFINC